MAKNFVFRTWELGALNIFGDRDRVVHVGFSIFSAKKNSGVYLRVNKIVSIPLDSSVPSVLGAGFTKVANELEQCFSNKVLNKAEENWELLPQYDSLKLRNRQVFDLIVKDNVSEENLTAEID